MTPPSFDLDAQTRKRRVPLARALDSLTVPVKGCYKKSLLESSPMQTTFPKDVISLSDLKINPGKVVNHTKNTHRPVLLTSRGRGVAIVQGLEDYESSKEELTFVKGITQGLMEIKEGEITDISGVKKRLGISR